MMKKIGMGGRYPAMVKPYHSMKIFLINFLIGLVEQQAGNILFILEKN